MRFGTKILCGLFAVLMVCVVPGAAYSVLSNGNTDNGNRPTVLVEYGTGKDLGLVKVTHIHYVKPADGGRAAKSSGGTCYKLAGWKWPGPVQYTIPDDPWLKNAIVSASAEWDAHTSPDLFTGPGEGVYTWGEHDSVNSVSWGDYPSDGVIAATMTWYRTSSKTAVESDILFDTGFTWGTTGEEDVMDVRNIATHEIGHTLGLADLYSTPCSPVTMYGFSGYGDIGKRILDTPDEQGLQRLYGP